MAEESKMGNGYSCDNYVSIDEIQKLLLIAQNDLSWKSTESVITVLNAAIFLFNDLMKKLNISSYDDTKLNKEIKEIGSRIFYECGSKYVDGCKYYNTMNKNAIKYLSIAIKLDPDYLNSYLYRGLAFRKTKQLDAAKNDFNFILNVKRDDEMAKSARSCAQH